jgi:hypothetical protein
LIGRGIGINVGNNIGTESGKIRPRVNDWFFSSSLLRDCHRDNGE